MSMIIFWRIGFPCSVERSCASRVENQLTFEVYVRRPVARLATEVKKKIFFDDFSRVRWKLAMRLLLAVCAVQVVVQFNLSGLNSPQLAAENLIPSRSPSFPHVSSGNPGEVLTGPHD
jgi:hypothetical protein